jgi:hypothetical protein
MALGNCLSVLPDEDIMTSREMTASQEAGQAA